MQKEENRDKEITKLTGIWYHMVGGLYHKDSDCHWYINKVWSYGNKPKYRIEHYGYIYSDKDVNYINEDFASYKRAEGALLKHLLRAIKQEIKSAKDKIANTLVWDIVDVMEAEKTLKIAWEYGFYG